MSKRSHVPKWTMRDGTQISVADMETNHIKNSLAMLERNGFIAPSTVHFMLTCPRPNGEMAEDDFDAACEDAFERHPHPMIDCLRCELSRRELED